MELKRFFTIISFFLFALILFSISSSAITEMIEYGEKCYNDGSFSFFVKNGKSEPINLKDTKIYVYNSLTRQGFTPEGNWDKDQVYIKAGEPEMLSAQYISKQGVIPERGDYIVSVEYEDCRDEPTCKVGFDIGNCAGPTEECNRYGISILGCNIENGRVYTKFRGDNPQFFDRLDLSKNLIYYVDSNTRDLMGKTLLPRMNLERYDEFTYSVSMPVLMGENITGISIIHKECDSPASRILFPCAPSNKDADKKPLDKKETAQPADEKTEDRPVLNEVNVEEAEGEISEETAADDGSSEETQENTESEFGTIEAEGEISTSTGEDTEDQIDYQRKTMPLYVILIVVAVMIILFMLLFTNIFGRRRKPKKDDEEFDRSFGFGD